MGTRWTRSWTASLLVAGMAGASALPSLALGAAPGAGAALVAVIVDGSSSEGAAAAVRAAGGVIDAPLDLIGGVAASVPADAITVLVGAGFLVVPDLTVSPVDHVVASAPVFADAAEQVLALNPGTVGGQAPGSGVTVGLIDTGVYEHADLAGRLVDGPDLSDDPEGSLPDGYGHGTFIAGLIAGSKTGVAPGATIVSIKVGDKKGDTTLRTLIQAIGWAVVHADTTGIDILNLSFGANTGLPPAGDPLVQAVEAAWASGLLVVVAAGNDGAGVVTSPGTSPNALTVGATDYHGTASTADDVVAPWSGSARDKPEVVAPGTSLVSLRAPKSFIDNEYPTSRIGDDYFVGSGTSMATALVTGAAAVVLGEHGAVTDGDVKQAAATNGDVKSALVDTAGPVTGGGATIDLVAAATRAATPVGTAPGRSGTGGSANSRPDQSLTNGWDGARWTGARWTGARWTGARWTGARWTEEAWANEAWAGARWTGARWTGARWTEEEWAGARWTGARWTGARWTGARWTGARWTMADESTELP